MNRCVARLMLLACLVGSVARADEPAGGAALAHARTGVEAYRSGDYRRALAKFRASYDINKAPGMLFNIAQALSQLGDYQEAIVFYRRYLAEAPPSGKYRSAAEKNLAELERSIPAATSKEPPPPSEPPPPPSAPLPPQVPAPKEPLKPALAGRRAGLACKAQKPEPVIVVHFNESVPSGHEIGSSRLRLEVDPEFAAMRPITPRSEVTTAEPPSAEPERPGDGPRRVEAKREMPATPNPGASPPPTPASHWWSPLRLSLTAVTAAIGLAAFGVGIWRQVEADELLKMALSIRDDDPNKPWKEDFILRQTDRIQYGGLIAFSIGGAAMLASIIMAIVPQFAKMGMGNLTAWITPTTNGFAIGGAF